MKTFTDRQGRDWPVEITVGSIKRVRDLCGVNLLDIADGTGGVLQRLYTDPIFLCDVLYCLIKPTADERVVTDEDFGRMLSGDALDTAAEAVLGELTDFFPKGRRKVMQTITMKTGLMMEAMLARAGKLADEIDVEKVVQSLSGPASNGGPGAGSSADSAE